MTTREQELNAGSETWTKRGRNALARRAARDLGFPFVMRSTTDDGEPRAWRIQTPTDLRVFCEYANQRLNWTARES